MSTRTLQLTDTLYQYLLQNLRESPVLSELRQRTLSMNGVGHMQISPEQGQFMALLIELMAAKKTLDIGVFTGYSSLAVALALPADGQVVACDTNAEWTAVAKEFWQRAGVVDKVQLHLAPATETLAKLLKQGEAGTFDFAFIDADKKNYPVYYEQCLELLRPNGLIVVDNVLQQGRVADPAITDDITQAIRDFNQKLFDDSRITLSMVPLGDGLTLARKR